MPHPSERLNVAGCSSHAQERTPDAELRQRFVDFGLGQQPLRLGHRIDCAEARLVPRPCLFCRGSRGGYLDRSVRRNSPTRIKERESRIPLCAEIGRDLLAPRYLSAQRSRLLRLPRPDGRQIENRERHSEAHRVVLDIRSESVQSAKPAAVDLGSSAADVYRALKREFWEIRPFQDPELRPCLFRHGPLLDRNRVGRGI